MSANTPAFPAQTGPDNEGFQSGAQLWTHPGMTLRDWFAGQVASGLAAHQYGPPQWDNIARDAYIVADAMLAEREKSA